MCVHWGVTFAVCWACGVHSTHVAGCVVFTLCVYLDVWCSQYVCARRCSGNSACACGRGVHSMRVLAGVALTVHVPVVVVFTVCVRSQV